MTRKRFIKLLMGRHGLSRNAAEAAAKLVHQAWCNYQNGYQIMEKAAANGKDVRCELVLSHFVEMTGLSRIMKAIAMINAFPVLDTYQFSWDGPDLEWKPSNRYDGMPTGVWGAQS